MANKLHRARQSLFSPQEEQEARTRKAACEGTAAETWSQPNPRRLFRFFAFSLFRFAPPQYATPALILLCLCGATASASEAGRTVNDIPFVQEIHEPHAIGTEPGMNDVRAVAVDRNGNVWAATKAGVYRLKRGERRWTALTEAADAGPAFAVAVDGAGTVWVGAWNGLYRSTPDGLTRVASIQAPISAVCPTNGDVVAAGPDGLWRIRGTDAVRESLPCSRSVRRIVDDRAGGLWIATGMGLTHHTNAGTTLYQAEDEIVSSDVHAVAWAPDGSLWAGGLGGITVYKDARRTAALTPQQGLPSVFVRSLCRGPDGVMWVGTAIGAARYDGTSWSLRHSRRWVLSDDVRDVAFDADGTAWIATAGGISAIRRVRMTLAQKAERFLDVCLSRHVREPGLVEKCRLRTPGDVTTWEPRDDDNDGQYTAMYLAMESFRYSVTRDPRARANARRAFEALRFLQTVTGTDGFVARTVVPASWTTMSDPNETLSDAEWADRRIADPRDKRVPIRWRPSSDGKWLWKGDTSSDEITGHFFGYHWYYDLAADEPQREAVRAHVRRVIDYIIDNGYVLKDLDGRHTRWGVWAPERLNHDPDWAPERGINSVEILSFLLVARHVTGDARYREHYLRLLHDHGYAANVRRAKTRTPAWRTYIDDELLALAYPALLKYEQDPAIRRLYRESVDHWYATAKDDASPYFHFTYAGLVEGDPRTDESVAFLRDAPLDLVRWRVDNTCREDIRLVRAPVLEVIQTHRLLPPSERGVIRWDDNPWAAIQGDAGETESDGVYWLLPYWMGRHYGFIREPSHE